MSRNEAVAVFAITFAAVVAYSAWGAYILHAQNAGSPQMLTIER
jgi:hypothetical protein